MRAANGATKASGAKMTSVLKYLRFWLSFARNSLLRQLEYKLNFIGRASVEVAWVSTQIVFFAAIFNLVPSLGHWSQPEIWFFLATLIIVDGVFMMLVYDNLTKRSSMVREGLLDFVLLRPVSSLFLTNFRYVNTISLTNISMGVGLMIWTFVHHGLVLSAGQVLLWFVYTTLGAATVIALTVLVSSLAFWTTQAANLTWFFFEIYRLGFRPETFYPSWIRRVLMTIFPAAFFISIPVQITLGKKDGAWFVYPFLACAVMWMIAIFVWKRGLKRYEGALS